MVGRKMFLLMREAILLPNAMYVESSLTTQN